jgi:glycosyltransferase involved in cell wall biosynthesis
VIHSKRVAVVLPAYNAEKTLEDTYREVPLGIVDDVILVDDASQDNTARKAAELGIRHVIVHPKNMGYGANQKSCYRKALALGADIVVMVHPDYQYTPKLIAPMATVIAEELYDVVLGSRILGVGALQGGMPLYKYVSNRALTCFQNLLLGYKLSEYHTGYRAFSRRVLETLPLEENGDDFVFDNEMLTQVIGFGFQIAEITCPTRYGPESSSISLARSIRYGLGVLRTSLRFRFQALGLARFPFLDPQGRRLAREPERESTSPTPAQVEVEAEVPELVGVD